MSSNIVVIPDASGIDLDLLRTVAGEFGWTVEVAASARRVAEMQIFGRTAAVLLHRTLVPQEISEDGVSATYWNKWIREAKEALPETPLVVCVGFSEALDWPGLTEAGAYHLLRLPLKENEVRQSFGFLTARQETPSAISQPG